MCVQLPRSFEVPTLGSHKKRSVSLLLLKFGEITDDVYSFLRSYSTLESCEVFVAFILVLSLPTKDSEAFGFSSFYFYLGHTLFVHDKYVCLYGLTYV